MQKYAKQGKGGESINTFKLIIVIALLKLLRCCDASRNRWKQQTRKPVVLLLKWFYQILSKKSEYVNSCYSHFFYIVGNHEDL